MTSSTSPWHSFQPHEILFFFSGFVSLFWGEGKSNPQLLLSEMSTIHCGLWTLVIVPHGSQVHSSSSPAKVGLSSQSLSPTHTTPPPILHLLFSLWISDIHSAPASCCNTDNLWLCHTHLPRRTTQVFLLGGLVSASSLPGKRGTSPFCCDIPPLVFTAESQLAWSREEFFPFSDTHSDCPSSFSRASFPHPKTWSLRELQDLFWLIKHSLYP